MFFLPKLPLSNQTVKTVDSFAGLDLRESIPDSALADCVNISPSGFPAISVCNPWVEESTPATLSDIFGIGSGDLIKVLDGSPMQVIWNSQKPDGTPSAVTLYLAAGDSLAAAERFADSLVLLTKTGSGWRLCQYNSSGGKIREVDMSSFLGGTDTVIGGMLSFERRLLILYNNSIRISFYNDLEKWDQYLIDGKLSPRAAQQHTIEEGGYFTCCINYKSHPVLLKQNALYLVQNSVAPYAFVKAADVGCINPRSAAICNGVLYFLSPDGVMAYNGSLPKLVSADCPTFPEELKDSGGCTQNSCYYIGNYAYAPEKEVWTKIRNSLPERKISAAGSYCGAVFYRSITAEGIQLYRYSPYSFDSDQTPEEWYIITKCFHENESRQKKLTKFAFRIEPQQEVSVSVLISADGGSWQSVYEGNTARCGAKEIVLKVPPCQDIKFKIRGTGKATIPYLRWIYRVIPDGKIHPFL